MIHGLSIDQIIDAALIEDIGTGDHTSLATIPLDKRGKTILKIKEDGIIAGLEIARSVFHRFDPDISIRLLMTDGTRVKSGDIAFEAEGRTISLLSCERLVLNFMQRMSGIATHTRSVVDRLDGLNTKVLDTRKTTPLLREIEKMAVRIGGGVNHRFGLYDMILIKDNHVDFAGGIKQALENTKAYLHKNNLDLKVEIEARNLSEVEQVLQVGGAFRVLLDNFSPDLLFKAVEMINNQIETEASGGITLENIRQYAETGVDYVSSGALTHHIKSMDLSLKAL